MSARTRWSAARSSARCWARSAEAGAKLVFFLDLSHEFLNPFRCVVRDRRSTRTDRHAVPRTHGFPRILPVTELHEVVGRGTQLAELGPTRGADVEPVPGVRVEEEREPHPHGRLVPTVISHHEFGGILGLLGGRDRQRGDEIEVAVLHTGSLPLCLSDARPARSRRHSQSPPPALPSPPSAAAQDLLRVGQHGAQVRPSVRRCTRSRAAGPVACLT